MPAQLDAGPLSHRPEAAVETAAYFVVSEALTNVAKHSRAGRCVIGLRHDAGVLRVWVVDDGVGGAAFDKGHGLRGLDNRVHAVGGRLRIVVADDAVLLREGLIRLLAEEGHQVVAAVGDRDTWRASPVLQGRVSASTTERQGSSLFCRVWVLGW